MQIERKKERERRKERGKEGREGERGREERGREGREGGGMDHGGQEKRETFSNLQEIYLKYAFLLSNKSRNN